MLMPHVPSLPVCCPPPAPLLQIGSILSMIYLFLIIVQVIVNLKNKPEAVEKVGRVVRCGRLAGWRAGG